MQLSPVWPRALCALGAFVLVNVVSSTALAGGFYLLPRGVRGVAQGGAVVAGSDDPGALWYNPAGLAYSRRQVLVDFLLPIERVDFARINAGGQREPTVSSTSQPLPIPGVGFSDNFGLDDFTFGIGMMAPTAALHNWPRYVAGPDGAPIGAPQRYSLVSMMGSGFANLSAGMAYRPMKYLSLGAAATAVIGRFKVNVVMSTCDNGLLCKQPESDRWDADANISVPQATGFPALIRPGGALGFVVDLAEMAKIRIGGSVTLPFTFSGVAQFDVELPEAEVAEFRGATLSGNQADFEVKFPTVVRLGVEYRPMPSLRVEVQATWENWAVQKEMRVEPRGIRIEAPLLGSYELGSLSMKRGMRDVFAVGAGVEYRIQAQWQLRTGWMVERGAFADPYFSILTPDTNKLVWGLGGTWAMLPNLLLDFTVGHVFMQNRSVRNSQLFQPYPLRPAPGPDTDGQWMPGEAVPLGNGDYQLEASFIGLGTRYTFAPW